MAKRRVIADSEDEDDDELELNCPEPKPLSQDHKQASDVTDPSFFASVYQDQQSLAAHQHSSLIETIIRASQRASASSSGTNVSLPGAQGKAKKSNPSSGTDVTSPVDLSRPKAHANPVSDEASDFTSPLRQNWDVPSSAEAPKVSARKKTTYGKTKRRRTELMSSPAAAKTFASEMAQEDAGGAAAAMQAPPTLAPDSWKPTPPLQHGAAEPDIANFYVAQSNLTTMQKLEFQKVNVPVGGYSGLPGSLANHKSSGATTIAYSTPLGYSSIPTLPWEPITRPASAQSKTAIEISSSPNEISCDPPNQEERSVPPAVETTQPNSVHPHPTQSPKPSQAGKRKRKASRNIEEVDELGPEDDVWDSNDIGLPQEMYKPRASKRRAAATNPEPQESPGFDHLAGESLEGIQPLPSTEIPAASSADHLAVEPETQPKKRGRKKKQLAVVDEPDVFDEEEEVNVVKNSAPTDDALVEEGVPTQKSKKRRGRPRKSNADKSAQKPVPDSAPEEIPEQPTPHDDGKLEAEEAEAEEQQEIIQPTKRGRKKKEKKKIIEDSDSGEGDENESEDEESTLASAKTKVPLKELDRNSMSPVKSRSLSQRNSPIKAEEAKSGLQDENSTPEQQQQVKETGKTAVPSSAQPKVPYRVGLSKRSRIAPLLKIIKK
ncbi:hypothetical protein F5Y16DRAFT_338410 [Xylariaceae sp. FL0255]|nr:hypothetical protein F5Y16DRAFT_338410 [Xylariaceae sp. FL0255]